MHAHSIAVCAFGLVAACSFGVEGPAPESSAPAPAEAQPAAVVSPGQAQPTAATHDPLPPDVIVEVNDHQLNLATAVREVDILLANAKHGKSPQELDPLRRQAMRLVVDQFVEKSLLLDEAERKGVTLTPADETNAVANLQSLLPPGVTVEQAMHQSPLGKERFRAELLGAATIKKLLHSPDVPESKIPDADYTAFTNQWRDKIEASDSVRASHILITTNPSDTPEQKEEKRKKAESLRAQLLKGADFAELAREDSDCPSKKQGGDLGRFGRRKMVKPFSDAAFQQEVGAIGDVVETQFGYHIIKVTERKSMDRNDILDIMRRQKILERLRKDARIKYNQPPHLSRPGVGATTSRLKRNTNTTEGIIEVNTGAGQPETDQP